MVSSKSLSSAGTRSRYTTGKKDEHKSGLRVKLTHTFAANGVSAPVFVSICGLNERELPVQDCPSGVLILDIAGLCIGGAGINAGSTLKGTIIFVRNDQDKETDKVRFRAYRERVFLPFIEEIRAEDGWTKGEPVDEEMRVVSWRDGDIAQVATIVEDNTMELYKEMKICANKQSAARSATEQATDLAKVFKGQHAVQKKSTMENVDATN